MPHNAKSWVQIPTPATIYWRGVPPGSVLFRPLVLSAFHRVGVLGWNGRRESLEGAWRVGRMLLIGPDVWAMST
jgi:hypothetical protein